MTSRSRKKQLKRSRLHRTDGVRRLLICLAVLAMLIGCGVVFAFPLHGNAKLRHIGIWYICAALVLFAAQHLVQVLDRLRRRRRRRKERDA